eukprot:TRINITY_DN345_c0_g2_i4.p1 TRINITY_DN345_c0_g2~~TRINITY_DN345_c0_g2_i4.p1  ORF type:complete len:272 (-),score=67.70 TRINITY_DN345_c0_g2_i4:96-827(-)
MAEHTGSGWVLRGNAAYHSGNYNAALEFYKKALDSEDFPAARWNIHNRLCATYTKLSEHTKALAEAEAMIQCDPEHPKGFVRKGSSGINAEYGRNQKKKKHPYLMAEHTGSGWVLRGNAAYHSGNYNAALEFYKKALDSEDFPAARWNIHNRLCATYTKLSEHTKALAEAEAMIQCDPEHPKGFVRKGGAHFFMGDYDDALDEYHRATKHLYNGKADHKLLGNLPRYVASAQQRQTSPLPEKK